MTWRGYVLDPDGVHKPGMPYAPINLAGRGFSVRMRTIRNILVKYVPKLHLSEIEL